MTAEALLSMPWRSDEAACYGVACHLHSTCARYHAIEGNTNDQQVFIDNCGMEHSAYVALVPSGGAEA